jgi:hypothetical protein
MYSVICSFSIAVYTTTVCFWANAGTVRSAVAATASTATIQLRFSMRASLGWSGR